MTFGAEDMNWVEPEDDSAMQDAIHGAMTEAVWREVEQDFVIAIDLHKKRIRQLQEALCECPHRDIFQASLHDETCPVYVVTHVEDAEETLNRLDAQL